MSVARAADEATTEAVAWEQIDRSFSFRVMPEREAFSTLDRAARVIVAVQVGRGGPALQHLSTAWRVEQAGRTVWDGTAAITSGLVAVSFPLSGRSPGDYTLTARLDAQSAAGVHEALAETSTVFRVISESEPPRTGRISVILPRGLPQLDGSFPVQFGVPFPKGALRDGDGVRMIRADGVELPCRTVVRSRWGHHPHSSIRWLGVDVQATPAPAWWPERQSAFGSLEFGPSVIPAATPRVTAVLTREGAVLDTGPLHVTIPRDGFTLFAQARLNGSELIGRAEGHGPYLVDHEGSVYRAANDRSCELSIEEQNGLRAVIRVAGWYVRDGATGTVASATLPTDRLCQFVTRIEAYAGKPYIRVLHTWVLTFDSHSVRLRDVGLNLPVPTVERAVFGQEEGEPLDFQVDRDGVHLVQHLPDAFAIESGDGRELAQGHRSDGSVRVRTGADWRIGLSLRDTWQRFPKELEVLPDAVRLHVWPAHGRDHPGIDPVAHEEIHKLWFAHQGRELNLAQPWDTFFAVARIVDDPSLGVYKGAGLALAGVHASAMGTAITTDFLVHFGQGHAAERELRVVADCFQAAPHALADPGWTCATEALGWLHPYDPSRFPVLEETLAEAMRGYWETQDAAGEFGMWLYRVWHHNRYLGDGKWELYRLYNATHHYEAFLPWMLYARSGDPFYLTQGAANIRQFSDVQIIHYDNPDYPHQEYHFGQKRLVGSTKHTNGFNTWGGDHAVFSHQTCYNAMIQAYYLTGDLRLREVLLAVQQTLVANRGHPEFARADRSLRVSEGSGGRDNANALGELLDLYQMTHHPALLAHAAPMLDTYLNQPHAMSTWGQPLHNLLSYYSSRQAADHLVAGARAARTATEASPADRHNLWKTHCPHEVYALAALAAPGEGFHVNAYFAAQPAHWRDIAGRLRAREARLVPFSAIPDKLLYLPRVMLAVARGTPDRVALQALQQAQSLPASDWSIKGWIRCVVREDLDHEIALRFTGAVGKGGKGGFPVRVYSPDNRLVLDAEVPEGIHAPYVMTLPKDGMTGQYVVFFRARDGADNLMAPLSELPEVYHVTHWQQNGPTRFYTQAPEGEKISVTVGPISGQGQILNRTGDRLLAQLMWGESMTADVDQDGVWIALQCRYAGVAPRVLLSITPERWFAPDEDKLALMP